MSKKMQTRSAVSAYKHGEKSTQETDPFETIDEENPTLKDLYNVMKEMFSSVNYLSKSYDDFKTKISKLEEENEELKNESKLMQKRLQHIETDYYHQQQLQLQNYVTIHGLPKQNTEELVNTVINTANILKVNVSQSNIESCRIMQNKNKTNPTPIIVVEFKDHETKQNFQTKYKANGPIIATQILKNVKGTVNEHRKIYVNDYLCSYYKELLENTKQIRTKHNIKFVWYKNGNIFARQNENTFTYKIKNYTDLNNLEEKLKN